VRCRRSLGLAAPRGRIRVCRKSNLGAVLCRFSTFWCRIRRSRSIARPEAADDEDESEDEAADEAADEDEDEDEAADEDENDDEDEDGDGDGDGDGDDDPWIRLKLVLALDPRRDLAAASYAIAA
jgi:hypothetical protein